MNIIDLDSIKIKLASPEDILKWSCGEVTKSETINYKSQKAEKSGLFCEKIFGPNKNYKCYCGKYKGIRYKGIICDRCGVKLDKALVRRERMGHIKLATPVAHIWFLKNVPSRIGSILDVPIQQLEKVIYFASYIVIDVNEKEKENIIKKIDKEYQIEKKNLLKNILKQKNELDKEEEKKKLDELILLKKKNYNEIESIKPLKIISEVEFYNLSLKYAEIFEVGIGSEAIMKILEKIDLKKLLISIEKEYADTTTLDKSQKILKRMRIIKGMINAQIRPEWMFLTVLPVLPPDLRPMVQLDGGQYASSDLNNSYRRIINRNNRLKHFLEIDAPEIIIRNEKRMLQEAVDSLLDNQMRKGASTSASIGGKRLLKSLADIIKGKTGRFRKNLLGKRVDYSGRSVIIGGPNLKLNQVGLPKKMALELFKPFIIKEILDKELAYNLKGAKNLIEDESDEVWEILEKIIKDKYLLLNRAPTLHRLSIQAFNPVLVEGKTIELHPLVCDAFNADFDGDTMAVHLPLFEEAQKEAKEIMATTNNLLKPATGLPIIMPLLDIVLGCYWLTKIIEEEKEKGGREEGGKGGKRKKGKSFFIRTFSNKEEAILLYELGHINLRQKIKVRINAEYLETSVGRILFNETLPPKASFENKEMTSKEIARLILKIMQKFSNDEVILTLDKIKEIGFEYSTQSSITWGMNDLFTPTDKDKIIKKAEKEIEKIESFYEEGLMSEEEKRGKTIQIWTEAKNKIEELTKKPLSDLSAPYYFINSGARGSWSQLIQMAGMKGLVQGATGKIIETPVKSCYKEGFNALEYFISTHGARKGSVSTALQTSVAGYLTRRLVDLSHNVIITENDCGDSEGIIVSKKDAYDINQDFLFKIIGRISLEDIKDGRKIIVKAGEIINTKQSEEIIKLEKIETIKVRSPLRCKCIEGLCVKCYGSDLSLNKEVKIGTPVGIIAAQSIGEPGTQLTMRVKLTGGVASALDITSGITRVIEILENRAPKGEAKIALKKGQVLEIISKKEESFIKETDVKKIIKIMSKEDKKGEVEIIEYEIPKNVTILVQEGDSVKKGQQLSEGTLNLKDLFKFSGREITEKYIINEVQKIYTTQGNVHDKYIEIIVRQMFNYCKIEDAGDTIFTKDEIVENSQLIKINNSLDQKQKKATAVPILLGITQSTLFANSFLSAASFQETSRVLIKASLEGKTDPLKGIKENVILGKLIPVGTGFKSKS